MERKRVLLRMPVELHVAVEGAAKVRGLSLNAWICEELAAALKVQRPVAKPAPARVVAPASQVVPPPRVAGPPANSDLGAMVRAINAAKAAKAVPPPIVVAAPKPVPADDPTQAVLARLRGMIATPEAEPAPEDNAWRHCGTWAGQTCVEAECQNPVHAGWYDRRASR